MVFTLYISTTLHIKPGFNVVTLDFRKDFRFPTEEISLDSIWKSFQVLI